MLRLADAVAAVPFTIGALLTGSFVDWMIGGAVGEMVGGGRDRRPRLYGLIS